MKKHLFLITLLLLAAAAPAQISKIVGDWVTVDDATGNEYAIVRIYQAENGKYYGKIAEMLFPGTENEICVKCTGEDHNQPILGMVIIRDMIEKDGVLQDGKVLEPESGKFYYGKISYVAKTNQLKLRGSADPLGIIGRTQLWKRRK